MEKRETTRHKCHEISKRQSNFTIEIQGKMQNISYFSLLVRLCRREKGGGGGPQYKSHESDKRQTNIFTSAFLSDYAGGEKREGVTLSIKAMKLIKSKSYLCTQNILLDFYYVLYLTCC